MSEKKNEVQTAEDEELDDWYDQYLDRWTLY